MSLTKASNRVIDNPLLFTGPLTLGTSNATDFNIQTNGTTRMTVTSGGNVGIGIATIDNTFAIKPPNDSIFPLAVYASTGVKEFQFGGYQGTSVSYPTLYIGNITPSGSNYALNGNGSETILNGLANIYIRIANSNKINLSSSLFRVFPTAVFDSNVGIGDTNPAYKLSVNGTGYFTGDVTVIGTTTTVVDLNATNITASAHIKGLTKSFLIDNPATGGKLQYGCVESNRHDVYVRGRTSSSVIDLPPEFDWLVDPDSITVNLTPIGKPFTPYVMSADNHQVVVGGVESEYFYHISGERVDVPKLQVYVEEVK